MGFCHIKPKSGRHKASKYLFRIEVNSWSIVWKRVLPIDWATNLRLHIERCDLDIRYGCFNCYWQINYQCNGDSGGLLNHQSRAHRSTNKNGFFLYFHSISMKAVNYRNSSMKMRWSCQSLPWLDFWFVKIYLNFSDSKFSPEFIESTSSFLILARFSRSLEIKIIRMYRSPRSQLHINLIRNYMLNIVMITSLVWFWLLNTNDKVRTAPFSCNEPLKIFD